MNRLKDATTQSLEAFRSGKCVDKLFILDGIQDGPIRTIAREARKKDTIINYVSRERLDQLSETRAHQGVIAQVASLSVFHSRRNSCKSRGKGGGCSFLVLLDNGKILIIWALLFVPLILWALME